MIRSWWYRIELAWWDNRIWILNTEIEWRRRRGGGWVTSEVYHALIEYSCSCCEVRRLLYERYMRLKSGRY